MVFRISIFFNANVFMKEFSELLFINKMLKTEMVSQDFSKVDLITY